MTPNQRILLNVVATYGRSLYALALGLFTSRWVLLSLGEVDFGLYGLVGGLTAFVLFVNNLMASAVMRFYGVSVGSAKIADNPEVGVEDCRKWFNTALMLHTLIPLVLIGVGYPLGEWAVRKFLVIPPSRIVACLWVWRFTCFSCLVGMMNVPFQAMYSAKQEIAELTLYSFCTTTVNALFLYYMVTHPGVWLARYALWCCFLSVTPQILIGIRAVMKFPECRFCKQYFFHFDRAKQVVVFALARTWTALSSMLNSQGRSILINRFLGPVYNASMAIGTQVTSHASTLSSSISTAFWPVIANTAGEGDVDRVRILSFQVCRLSTVMVLVFLIPLSLEIDEVLRLWLKEPPAFAAQICLVVMFAIVCERLSEGYWMAVMGLGRRVGYYSWWMGWTALAELMLTTVLFFSGWGIRAVYLSIVISNVLMILVRLYLGRVIVNMSVLHWIRQVCMPILILSGCSFSVGTLPRFYMGTSFARICVTTAMVEIVLLPCAWFFVLEMSERAYLASRIERLVAKFNRRR